MGGTIIVNETTVVTKEWGVVVGVVKFKVIEVVVIIEVDQTQLLQYRLK